MGKPRYLINAYSGNRRRRHNFSPHFFGRRDRPGWGLGVSRRWSRSIGRSSSSSSCSSSSSNSSNSRSRSRSWGRDRSRSRGRDRSRSRGRDRSRSRGRDRSRSRGRDRSRSRGRTRSRTRSRSRGYSRGRSRSGSRERRSCSRHRSGSMLPWSRRQRRFSKTWHNKSRSPSMRRQSCYTITICDDSDTSTNDAGGSNNTINGLQQSTAKKQASVKSTKSQAAKTWLDYDIGAGLKDYCKFCSKLKATKQPSEFQIRLLANINTGSDVIAVAESFNHKNDTMAVTLPIFKRIVNPERKSQCQETSPVALILAPTSERVEEIRSHCEDLTEDLQRDLVCLDGNRTVACQKRDLVMGSDFIVSTPSRLVEMLATLRDSLNFTVKSVKYVVLIDADDLCRMGFVSQVKAILGQVNSAKQVVLTSTFFPSPVSDFAKETLRNPVKIPGGFSGLTGVIDRVAVLEEEEKRGALLEILRTACKDDPQHPGWRGVVLVDNESSVQTLADSLEANSFNCCVLDSDDPQKKMDAVIKLRSGSSKLMVKARSVSLTDGGDAIPVAMVINFDCPPDLESYVASCRLIDLAKAETNGSTVHTFITREQATLSGSLVTALNCSMSPVPDDLKDLLNSCEASGR